MIFVSDQINFEISILIVGKIMASAAETIKTTIQDQQRPNEMVNEWLTNSYAQVAKKKTVKSQTTKPKPSRNQRKSNTYTFYNLMTAEDITEVIIKELENYFKKKAKDLITKIIRDTRFRSRYQVTFNCEEDVENILENGITINGIKIRGYVDREMHAIGKPTRFYIPNLPSFLNEDDVRDLVNEEQTVYIKQKINRRFGVPSGGFFVGIFDAEKEDKYLSFEKEEYRMVCLDKVRNVATHNASRDEAAQDTPPEPPATTRSKTEVTAQHTPPEPTPLIQNETKQQTTSPMETQQIIFSIEPTQTDFVFGKAQRDDPLALTTKEKRSLKKLEKKENLSGPELNTMIELTNRSYCTTSPDDSESTKSGDTIKTTTSIMSTKRKKTNKHRQKKKK